MMAREEWTDERMNDLKGQVEKGFDEAKGEIREVKGEIREVKGEVGELRTEMNTRFNAMQAEMNLRFEAVQKNMTYWFLGLFSTILASLIAAVFAVVSLA